MKIVITGGAGFIGSRFTELALSNEMPEITEVVVIDKLTYAGKLSNLDAVCNLTNFTFVNGDICDKKLVLDASRGAEIILNFAAETHVDRSISSATPFVITNIVGTHVLLECMKENNINRFIQISTDEVYGSSLFEDWLETSNLEPNSPYSASKASADLLCYSYFKTYGLNINITRSCNNFGPRQHIEKLIPKCLVNAFTNKKIPVYGTGNNVREWIFVDDHCLAIYKVIKSGKPGEIYNIGGQKFSNIQLVSGLLEKLGKNLDLIEFVADRPGHDFRYSVNWEKISKLGFIPKNDFDSSIEITKNWYLLNAK